MKVKINGAEQTMVPGATLQDAIREFGASPSKGMAAAVDGEVVPTGMWEQTTLADGSVVEIVRAVAGG